MVICMSIITISRQDGSLGNEIAEELSKRLKMELIKRDKVIAEWMPEVANNYELRMLSESPKFFLNNFKENITFKEYIEKRLKEEAEKESLIIVGMGGQVIFAEHEDAIHIRISASDNVRILRLKNKYGFSDSDAEKLIQKSDRRHKRYIAALYNIDWADALKYDITLNTDKLSLEDCVMLIMSFLENKATLKTGRAFEETSETEKTVIKGKKEVLFKHPAEAEFAKILDMYHLDWEYEPRTFPVQWDAEGNVTMAFSPDFYLTKFDTYIEITTMEQKYVTTKNKKVRKLRELYPNINITIVYKKDFHSLLKRFGFSGGDEIDEFNRS
jgi:cytidylate kinase